MKLLKLAALLALPSLLGCVLSQPIWHDQLLPSGKTIKVISFNLVWGIEHDERDASRDCLALDFVSADFAADQAAREREAREVFELIRPGSELWGFQSAIVSGFASVDRRGRRDIFTFTREGDAPWSLA